MSTAAAATVVIHVFGLFHPKTVEIAAVAPAQSVEVRCPAKTVRLEGVQSMSLQPGCTARGVFALSIPGKIRRIFQGNLRIEPGLTALVEMDLEQAVASVVAAELPANTPPAALEAQAIAARSYYVAAVTRGRHAYAAFCDTTHCQHIRGLLPPGHPAVIAARNTKGLILEYEGRPVAAMYSASCQGLRESGGPSNSTLDYPYFPVPCAYCRRNPSKDNGLLHKRGLCQAGSADMAREGRDAHGILAHYYPGTKLRSWAP
jgi:peptidoglycan hydrolase-like amidase